MQHGPSPTAIEKIAALMNLSPDAERSVVLDTFTEQFSRFAPHLGESEVELFDLVFLDMVRHSTTSERARLAEQLAPIPNAPSRLVVDLAFDDEIIVAGPLLSQSLRLDEDVVLTIAAVKGQQHLASIAVRPVVTSSISDLLIQRGEEPVILALAANPGATFSPGGKIILSDRALLRLELFIIIDRRSDFGKAILDAYERRHRVPVILALGQPPRDLDGEVATLVAAGDVSRALALIAIEARTRLCVVEKNYQHSSLDSFVIITRAANLSWGTVMGLLLHLLGVGASAQQINQCRRLFDGATQNEALRSVHILSMTYARLYGAA